MLLKAKTMKLILFKQATARNEQHALSQIQTVIF
ncbi:hypothetical protein PM8797T_08619 [Gimesia maris DSM 8797]|nr:hypothetical protein PM8797T_08619 [Gimesia maris DSM 8797]